MRRFTITFLLMLAICSVTKAQTSFYTDRAIQQVNQLGIPNPVLSSIPYGSVRVCNLPLTQQQPCLPLANITDSNGSPLSNSIGSNFGQATTDATGRYTIGCVPGANLQVQIQASASNTPAVNYPITCPSGLGVGTNLNISNLTVSGTGTWTTANGFYYVGGPTYPATQAGVQAAFTAACTAFPNGTTVYIGPGTISLASQTGQLLLITCPLNVIGADENGTVFSLAPGISSAIPVIRIQPATQSVSSGYTLREFSIQSSNGTATAGDAIFLDNSNANVGGPWRIIIEHVMVGLLDQPNFGTLGRAVNTGGSNCAQTFTYQSILQIRDSLLTGGVNLTTCATDSTIIDHNRLQGSFAGVEISTGFGASNVVVTHNNGVSIGGDVLVHQAQHCEIRDNQFEQKTATTETNSAMIDLSGDVSTVDTCEVTGNNLNTHGLANFGVRIDHANNSKIGGEPNFINVSTGASAGVTITANASNSEIGRNTYTVSGGAVAVSDSGVRTQYLENGATSANKPNIDVTAGSDSTQAIIARLNSASATKPSITGCNANGLESLTVAASGAVGIGLGGICGTAANLARGQGEVNTGGTSPDALNVNLSKGFNNTDGGNTGCSQGFDDGVLKGWIQCRNNVGANNTAYPLQLNPLGGAVQAGAANLNTDAVYGTYRVTADQTITAGASLTNIPGLTWTMPANTALNVAFSCHLSYSQATAAASDQFGIQDVTVAPTNIFTKKTVWTSTAVALSDNTPTLTTTTATAIGAAFTPSAATTVFNADIDGIIEQPANASSSVINIMAQFTTNNGTIKRGSYCRVW